MKLYQLELFDDKRIAVMENRKKQRAKEKWLSQKSRNFGLEFCANAVRSGKYGIPLINPYHGTIPQDFATLSEIYDNVPHDHGIVCVDYDFELENFWVDPYQYFDRLSKYVCFSGCDFSMRVDDPLCVQIANAYKNHASAFCAQENNIPTLPLMSWAGPASYEFCFDGYSKGGAVMVPTIGTCADERSRMYFKNGFLEMLKRISPDAVVLYGDVSERIMSLIPSGVVIYCVEHKRFSRARSYGR